jgi:hypothetical protein
VQTARSRKSAAAGASARSETLQRAFICGVIFGPLWEATIQLVLRHSLRPSRVPIELHAFPKNSYGKESSA